MFSTAQKSSIFLPEIITPVISTNIMGSYMGFIPTGRSFMYNANCKDPITNPWVTPFFNVPHLEKTF
jgi:hypothetical protein